VRNLHVLVASYLALGTAGLAAQTPATGQAVAPATRVATRIPGWPNLLRGTRASVLTTIQGNALDSTNGALPDNLVRLRDARFGRIVDIKTTDRTGLFAFRGVDPGMYLVEVVGTDATVLATSQVIAVNAGEAISTVVKLPFRIPVFANLLGQATQTAATQSVVAAAASTGVLTTGPLPTCVTGPCQ
jgi:hypothetical protein